MSREPSIQLISELVDAQRYGVEYQPLIDIDDGRVRAFEALARFYTPDGSSVPPLDVFKQLHDSPMMLARVEYQLKKLQLAYRPEGVSLFINLDPDAYLGYGATGLDNPLLSLIAANEDLVVELIENTSVNDAEVSQQLCDALRQINIQLALDDVGAPESMVSLPILGIVDYIKFDRSWLLRQSDDNNVRLLAALVGYAHQTGKKTVLEGVETEADLSLARELGVDLVQGYLYSDQFYVVTPRHIEGSS